MAKLRLPPSKATPHKRRARVTVQVLTNFCCKTPPEEILKGLRKLQPVREILLGLLDTLKSLGSRPEIVNPVLEYCRERGCDPNATPTATQIRRTPTHDGDKRIFRVQRETASGRSYVRVPLSTLEKAGTLKRVELQFTKREGKPRIEIEAVS